MSLEDRTDDELVKMYESLTLRLSTLKNEEWKLVKQINEIKAENIIRQSSFCVGDVVLELDSGNHYQISGASDEWMEGRKIKKDGQPGSVERHLYYLDSPGKFELAIDSRNNSVRD